MKIVIMKIIILITIVITIIIIIIKPKKLVLEIVMSKIAATIKKMKDLNDR